MKRKILSTIACLMLTVSISWASDIANNPCPGGICQPPIKQKKDPGASFYQPEQKKDEPQKQQQPQIPEKEIQKKIQEKVSNAPLPGGGGQKQPQQDTKGTLSKGETKGTDIKTILDGVEIQDIKREGETFNNVVEIFPEVTTKVDLSNSDINRITCPVEIRDVVYSQEKGLMVRIQGRNAFIKYVLEREDSKLITATVPTEIYIVCGDDVYSLIAYPKSIPAKIIKLSKGKEDIIKKNLSIFKGMPYEKKILTILRYVFLEEIPDSFSILPIDRSLSIFKEIDISLKRIITVEGEGILVKEYVATAKEDVILKESNFFRAEFTQKTIAISIDNLILKKNEKARILIVERGKIDG